jgi:hypothetical protein
MNKYRIIANVDMEDDWVVADATTKEKLLHALVAALYQDDDLSGVVQEACFDVQELINDEWVTIDE